MPEVRPFTGYLFDPAVTGPLEKVTAPPYDAITPVDQDRYYGESPYNVIRLILGKEEPGDLPGSDRYTRAAEYLHEWREKGILVATEEPSLYPYEMSFHLGGRDRQVRGVIAEVAVEGWGGSIRAHERTLPGPLEDRLALIRAVQTNLSPIYGIFPGPSREVAEFLDEAMRPPPAREVLDENGTRHRLWSSAEEAGRVASALRDPPLMIADGHHRYTVALAYREEMRARFGAGPWDGMMMFVVDAGSEDPPVLPIHRVIRGSGGSHSREHPAVRDMAEILASVRDDEMTYGSVEMEDGLPVHRLGRLEGHPPTVCALHEQVLDPLGISGSSLRFVPDAVAAERLVLSGEASVAYLLPPTKVERVREVIDSGRQLPQKSTYFWPKPRTGMVLRPHRP